MHNIDSDLCINYSFLICAIVAYLQQRYFSSMKIVAAPHYQNFILCFLRYIRNRSFFSGLNWTMQSICCSVSHECEASYMQDNPFTLISMWIDQSATSNASWHYTILDQTMLQNYSLSWSTPPCVALHKGNPDGIHSYIVHKHLKQIRNTSGCLERMLIHSRLHCLSFSLSRLSSIHLGNHFVPARIQRYHFKAKTHAWYRLIRPWDLIVLAIFH